MKEQQMWQIVLLLLMMKYLVATQCVWFNFMESVTILFLKQKS